VKLMLELGYLHVVFPLKLRSHLSKAELPHATKMNGNNSCNKIYFPPHFTYGVAEAKTLCRKMCAMP
jgi:hypothetical protein